MRALGDPTLPFDAGSPVGVIGDYRKAHALGRADLVLSYER